MPEAVDPVRKILLEELEALHNNHGLSRSLEEVEAMAILAQQITLRDRFFGDL